MTSDDLFGKLVEFDNCGETLRGVVRLADERGRLYIDPGQTASAPCGDCPTKRPTGYARWAHEVRVVSS